LLPSKSSGAARYWVGRRLSFVFAREKYQTSFTGWKNKMQVAISRIAPATAMVEQHRKQAQPGSAGS